MKDDYRQSDPKMLADIGEVFTAEYREMIDYFIYSQRNKSTTYVSYLRYYIIDTMKKFQDQGVYTLADAKPDHYSTVMKMVGRIGYAGYTHRVKAFRKMTEWAFYKGLIDGDTFMRVKLIKMPPQRAIEPSAPLSDNEIKQMFLNVEKKFPYDPLVIDKKARGMNTDDLLLRKSIMHVQLKTLLWFGLETGCRIAEIWPLTIDDVDPINDSIGVLGKGNKWREVPYSDLLKSNMKIWLAHRAIVAQEGEDNLWLSMWGRHRQEDDNYGRPVSYHAFYKWSNWIFGETSATNTKSFLESKGRWHRYRKTFATRNHQLGMDLAMIGKALGQEDTRTTMIYIGLDRQRMLEEAAVVEDGRAEMYRHAIEDD